MKNKSTNIAEILESVDSIVSNNVYDNYGKRKHSLLVMHYYTLYVKIRMVDMLPLDSVIVGGVIF